MAVLIATFYLHSTNIFSHTIYYWKPIGILSSLVKRRKTVFFQTQIVYKGTRLLKPNSCISKNEIWERKYPESKYKEILLENSLKWKSFTLVMMNIMCTLSNNIPVSQNLIYSSVSNFKMIQPKCQGSNFNNWHFSNKWFKFLDFKTVT